jgi:hypothetical protein
MSDVGRYLPLSKPRRLICDMMHFARQVPTVPVQRRMNVALARDARRQFSRPIGWCALFTKAYGIVAREFPPLRRAYLGFPWARLYEHPSSIASIAIERDYQGEPGVFFIHLRGPESQPLPELDAYLKRAKHDPIESIPLFRRALLVCSYPRPLRRLFWWIGLNSSGYKRAKRMGTFGVSVYSSLGADSLHPLGALTTTLNYGPIADSGAVDVRIVYDHRVLDGATVARALARLEAVMNQEIVEELRLLRYVTPTRRNDDGSQSLAG